MFPRTFHQAVVERQRRDIEADIGRALHVAMAAENVGTRTKGADISGCEQQRAIGPHVRGADGVLRSAHAPDERGRLHLRECLGNLLHLFDGNASNPFDLIRRPFGDLGTNLIHAVHPLSNELLVFPAIGKDMMQHAPDHRDIGAATEPNIFRRVRSGAREARI